MADLTMPQGIVDEGVIRMAKAKDLLDKAYDAIGKLDEVFAAGGKAAMAGALKVDLMRSELKVAQGHTAHARACMSCLHIEGTKIAQDNGVDPPQPMSGGGR